MSGSGMQVDPPPSKEGPAFGKDPELAIAGR